MHRFLEKSGRSPHRSIWEALCRGTAGDLEHCHDICGNQAFMKTAHCSHSNTSMMAAHGDHSTELIQKASELRTWELVVLFMG